MSWESSLEILAGGGPVMYVLLLVSLTATAIVLLKAVQFSTLGLRRTGPLDAAAELAATGHGRRAVELLAGLRHPAAAVLSRAVSVSADPAYSPAAAQAEVGRVGSKSLRELESWLRALSSLAHLSPLLGLLGTVLGMITSFRRIEQAGSAVDPAILSGGIWEALLTTAFGLTIAIPSMAAFYVLEGEVDRVRATMKDTTSRVLLAAGKIAAPDEPGVAPSQSAPSERESYGV
jgi:biopolymer transport protein ExbB